MIHAYLKNLTDFLLSNPQLGFKKGVSLAFRDSSDRVLTQPDPKVNEFVWAGLSDSEGNYFYIRHRDSGLIKYETSPLRFSSCAGGGQLAKYELRLVACMREINPYLLEEGLSRVMLKFPRSQYCEGAVEVVLVNSNLSSLGVLEEEVPEKKQFDPSLIFMSMDFDLGIYRNQ